MPMYNKLVRDRIISEIEDSGRGCTYSILGGEDYLRELKLKLQEEVQEYLDVQNVEELTDILEVVFALAKTHGLSEAELLHLQKQKREEKGAFDQKLFLVEVSGE